MSRRSVPRYTVHKASGQARVRIDGKDHYLGPHGSPESHQRYARLISDWQTRQDAPPSGLSIKQLTVLYLERCRRHYRKNGAVTSEVSAVKIALRHLNALYRQTPAAEFSPKMLKAVRQSMINAGYVRTSINRHIGRIRRMFKWAVSEELLPVTVLSALETVSGLLAGRSDATEADPVQPVPQAFIDAVKPFVSKPVWGMIRLQLATGMRPGEVRILRGCDLNTSGQVWEFVPETHKTEHHGRQRLMPCIASWATRTKTRTHSGRR